MISKIIIFCLSLISTLGFYINLDPEMRIMDSFSSGAEISFIVIWMAFYFVINKAFKKKENAIIPIIVGIILAILETIGNSIWILGGLTSIIETKGILVKYFIKFLYYSIMFSSIIKIVFEYISKKILKNEKEFSFFTNNKKSLFVVAGFLVLFWIPYFLYFCPGIIDFDAREQLLEAVGVHRIINASPICTTLFLKLIITITQPIVGNLTISVAIIVFLKMLFMAFTISYGINYLASKGVNFKIRVFVLLFFVLNPLFILYSICLDKDSVFAVCLLMDFLMLFEFITNTEDFIKSFSKKILAFLFIILTILVRHNGMYLYVAIIPFLYIVLRKKYIKLTAFIAGTLIIVKIINTILFNIYEVPGGGIEGLLCAPVQAISRLVAYNDENLTEEEKKEIDLFLVYEQLAEPYNPRLSDPEMVNIRTEYLNNNFGKFVALNFKLFFKYPGYYLDSILSNTSGYYYIGDNILIIGFGVLENEIGVDEMHLFGENCGLFYIPNYVIQNKMNLPFFGILCSVAIALWLDILLLFYIIYKKNYKLIISLIPFLVNYIIIFLGPCNSTFRYVLPMYLPLAIMYCVIIKQCNTEPSSKEG